LLDVHVAVCFERQEEEENRPYQLEVSGKINFPASSNDSSNISKTSHKSQGKPVGLEEPGAVAIQGAFGRTF